MSLRIEQESAAIGGNWWKWAVWIEGSPAELDDIEAVTYILHPTFPEPVRRLTNRDLTNREAKFRLDSSGWGEFTIKANVERKDGEKILLEAELRLSDQAPARGMTTPAAPRVFVSHGAADAGAATALRDALQSQHVEVVDTSKLRGGIAWADSATDLLRSSDAMVVLASGTMSAWVEREVALARQLNRPILPITIGPGAELPEDLAKEEGVHLKDPADAETHSGQIAAAVRKIIE